MTIHFVRNRRFACLAVLLALASASPASAQGIGPSGQPEFRDPKTGQVWTPENVGTKTNPTAPRTAPSIRAARPPPSRGSFRRRG